MKKTYTINLGGKIFHIDDDALDKLQEYLNTLKMYYTKEEDGTEIMDDIENRIGELFSEYMKKELREVVTRGDVEQAITVMGTPDDIIDDTNTTPYTAKKQMKKLYRDPDDRFLSGVASGIAAYWGLPAWLVRVGFVFLTLFFGIFISVYIILWISVPKARTAKQKLEMKGEDINVSNIERSIKDKYQEFKEGEGANCVRRCGESFSDIVIAIGKILSTIVGVLLFTGGILTLFLFLSVLFLPHLFPWGENFMGVTNGLSDTYILFSQTALLLSIGIPILMIIFVAIKLLFPFRSNNKAIAFSALALWLLGVVMSIIIGVRLLTTQQVRYTERVHNSVIHKKFITSKHSKLNENPTILFVQEQNH